MSEDPIDFNRRFSVKREQITVGTPLPWNVHSKDGKLLLRRGETIVSGKQLNALLSRGLYRFGSLGQGRRNGGRSGKEDPGKINPFTVLADSLPRQAQIHHQATQKSGLDIQHVVALAQGLCIISNKHPDACLGAIQLYHPDPYSQTNPIHQGLLSALMAQQLALSAEQTQSLVCAALTANLSMMELQEKLDRQSYDITERQRKEIRQHPIRSAQMLQKAGVRDQAWLDCVQQHHERLDGSGYPKGAAEQTISPLARILALVDRYVAIVSPRPYHKQEHSPQHAMKETLVTRGTQYDEYYSLVLIKLLTRYPPGSFVKLESGESAIVTCRGDDIRDPQVSAYSNAQDIPYARPIYRDTSELDYSIVSMHAPRNRDQLNLSRIWGYR